MPSVPAQWFIRWDAPSDSDYAIVDLLINLPQEVNVLVGPTQNGPFTLVPVETCLINFTCLLTASTLWLFLITEAHYQIPELVRPCGRQYDESTGNGSTDPRAHTVAVLIEYSPAYGGT